VAAGCASGSCSAAGTTVSGGLDAVVCVGVSAVGGEEWLCAAAAAAAAGGFGAKVSVTADSGAVSFAGGIAGTTVPDGVADGVAGWAGFSEAGVAGPAVGATA
jgi:hypothetical protein